LCASCINEGDPAEGQLVTLMLSPSVGVTGTDTRADGDATGSGIDNTIQEFRVMIFRSGGVLVYNEYTANIGSRNPFDIRVQNGLYDFVFIANEGSDNDSPTLTSKLSADFSNKTMAYFEANSVVRTTAITDAKNIPMAAVFRNVEVLGNNSYKIGGGSTQNGTWPVSLKRLGVRVDVDIVTGNLATSTAAFSLLTIGNLPPTVPIVEKNASNDPIPNATGTPIVRTYAASAFTSSGNGTSTPYKLSKKRIILPSSTLATADNAKANGIYLKFTYTNGDPDAQAPLSELAPASYVCARNNYYLFSAGFHQFDVEITDWTAEDLEEHLEGEY
jgi:hypothetical protein